MSQTHYPPPPMSGKLHTNNDHFNDIHAQNENTDYTAEQRRPMSQVIDPLVLGTSPL